MKKALYNFTVKLLICFWKENTKRKKYTNLNCEKCEGHNERCQDYISLIITKEI